MVQGKLEILLFRLCLPNFFVAERAIYGRGRRRVKRLPA